MIYQLTTRVKELTNEDETEFEIEQKEYSLQPQPILMQQINQNHNQNTTVFPAVHPSKVIHQQPIQTQSQSQSHPTLIHPPQQPIHREGYHIVHDPSQPTIRSQTNVNYIPNNNTQTYNSIPSKPNPPSNAISLRDWSAKRTEQKTNYITPTHATNNDRPTLINRSDGPTINSQNGPTINSQNGPTINRQDGPTIRYQPNAQRR
jgi:hypothetical protein